MNDDMKQAWRDELGSDAAWDAVATEPPPPLAAGFRRRDWWPAATAAATVLLVVSLAINLVQSERLSESRTETLLARLQQESPLVTLASLQALRQQSLSSHAVEALRDVVRFSDDPNAQLSALELLYELRQIDTPDAVEQLLAETQSNAAFIRAAVRSITEESA